MDSCLGEGETEKGGKGPKRKQRRYGGGDNATIFWSRIWKGKPCGSLQLLSAEISRAATSTVHLQDSDTYQSQRLDLANKTSVYPCSDSSTGGSHHPAACTINKAGRFTKYVV